ncbi:coiled-coil domain-containing protein 34-like [Periophthalmus magnuspinnatus]|uniref:coiled-coil domain-containing protein 34-like n=1 Tax=Periophthalmus magnuspinnatus TaxID=409849 RepID=UPI00145A14D4|nr:coiled-coil domain-containing protein 34-like [Periophthalmus magnuspinnatus]
MSSFATNGFSSTPVKKSRNREKDFHKPAALDLDVGVISDDEDTFSLLSPIYHDSFESGEDISQSSGQSPPKGTMDTSVLSDRCELPKTPSDQMLSSAVPQKTPASLSAWELWLLNKAKEDRIKLEKKAEEERLLQEKKNQQEKDHEQKVAMINQRIQEWLKMKREQEKQEQDLKQSKEQKDLMLQMQKQREIELKAQDKYKEWLQKKNQEKAEKEKKLKEEAALKEAQEKERRRRAEEKFKEWLSQANTKNTVNRKSTCQGPYGKSYPSPSFYNPIPWKPIHIPPETVNNTTDRKAQRQPEGHQSLSSNSRQRKSVGAARSQQRR